MATALSILQEFSNDNLENVDVVIKAFLNPVLAEDTILDSTVAKGYGSFALKFLHASASKVKKLTDVQKIKELLSATEICCACYLKVQEELSLDDEYYVPKLVFHVLSSVKDEHCVDDVKPLCKQMFIFLSTKSPLSAAGEKIAQSLFACLWNLANHFGPQKENKLKIETVHELRKHALMFRCLLPNSSGLVERIRETMLNVVSAIRNCQDVQVVENCNLISVGIFSEVLKYLKSAENSQGLSVTYLRIAALYMENLIEMRNFDMLEHEIGDIFSSGLVSYADPSRKQLLQVLLDLYKLAGRISTLITNGKHLETKGGNPVTMGDNSMSKEEKTVVLEKENSSGKLSRSDLKTNRRKNNSTKKKVERNDLETKSWKENSENNFEFDSLTKISSDNLIELFGCLTQEEFSLLFWGSQFVCSLIGSKTDLTCVSLEMVEVLLNCGSCGISAAKAVLDSVQKQGKYCSDGQEKTKQEVFKPDAEVRVYQNLFLFYFKKLLMMYHLLLNSDNSSYDWSVYDEICNLAAEFESYLELCTTVLSAKTLSPHRSNCAYICSKIANHCLRQVKNYDSAILLNTIVLKQLRLCDSSQTRVAVQSLVDCYMLTGQRQEAVKVIIESAVLDGDSGSCVALWVELKKEALAENPEAFLSKTLSSMIGHVDNHQTDLVGLLKLEYNAWKKISRRNYLVEFYILCELVEYLDMGIEKCTYMIELARTMCITGTVYKERSAGSLLSEVIGQLDDSSSQSQAVLAMANFTKYVVSHEETVMDLNAQLKKEETEVAFNVNEAGDSIQSTPNRPTSEQTTNQTTPDRNTSMEPTHQGSSFTLAMEKSYLKYLHRAVELWEKCMRGGAKLDGIDLSCHIEALVACGTRLVATKQPSLALKVLRLAQGQITNLKDRNFISHLEEKLAKVLMLLGMYEEAETLISSDCGTKSTTASQFLLKAELHLLMGKRQEGVEILNQVLGEGEDAQLTKSLCLVSGSAKRLLSMFLCFPGDHVVDASRQYLLTLANDAVRRHISVLRLVDKPEISEKKSESVEKWTSVLETLQSLLHLCQLYRMIGLPRNALCYLKEGWKISQAQGLARWACEFLFEMLRVQSLEADSTSAVNTIDEINKMLGIEKTECQSADTKNVSSDCARNLDLELSNYGKNFGSYSHSESLKTDANKSPECFGFENLVVTPKPNQSRSSITPGKTVATGELTSCQKLKLAHISVPQCQCSNGGGECKDVNTHRLYTEAGLVIAEFLAACEMKTKAKSVLNKLFDDNKLFLDFRKMVKNSKSFSGKLTSKSVCLSSDLNSAHLDPGVKHLSLEANCILAEVFGKDKKYDKVQQIWHDVKKLDESGFFVDVLHSNILVARLALCEATSFLESLTSSYTKVQLDISSGRGTNSASLKELDLSPQNPEIQDVINDLEKTNETDTSVIEEKFEDLILSKKKVTFGERNEVFIVQEPNIKKSQQKGKGSRKKISSDKENNGENLNGDIKLDFMTPKKVVAGSLLNNIISTPKNQISYDTPSSSKRGLNINTPWSVNNRKTDLDRLLEDSDDDMPRFPDLKPVTPKADLPAGRKAAKSKTEPKKTRKKTTAHSKGIVCDWTKAYQQPTSQNENEDKSRSADSTGMINKVSDCFKDSSRVLNEREPHKHSNNQTSQNDMTLDSSNCKLEVVGITVQKKDKDQYINAKGRKTRTSKVKEKENLTLEDSIKNIDANKLDFNRFFFKRGHTSDTKSDYFSDSTEKENSEKLNLKDDVFDFDTEASPVVHKTKRGQKSKTSSKVKVKTNQRSKIPVEKIIPKSRAITTEVKHVDTTKSGCLEEDSADMVSEDSSVADNMNVEVLEQEVSVEEKVVSTKKGRKTTARANTTVKAKRPTRVSRKAAEEMEVPRNCDTEFDQELNASLDSIEITFDSDSENIDDISVAVHDVTIMVQEIISGASNDLDSIVNTCTLTPELEPIEILRSDRKPLKGKGSGRRKSAKSADDNIVENDSDESETGVEEMRSSRLPSSLDLSRRLNCSVDVSVRSSGSSGSSTADQQNIILVLENVYNQIRQLAPYPQHSDICQILALQHLHTSPWRAAFLLSDSIAVTFRHQALLNLNKKVRKQKTDDSEEKEPHPSTSSLQVYVDGMFFNKDESKLQEMIDILPADWTVLQVSVVNQGSLHQPALVTRFARNQSPVVVQVPGFSTPQSRQILSNFSSVLKKNQDVMKITVKADWWRIRRELDSDLQTLVEHMEMFWVGHWRGLLNPRQFTLETVNKLLKEIKKRTKMTLEPSHAEVLLQSVEHLKDGDLHKCVTELLSSNCSSSETAATISLVKETAASAEKTLSGHVVLILDKAIQHLPWECMPSLRSHSVSRMPCLSHLYTQLNYLQSQENSIFVRGVNPENTYYMVNPDNNLPNAEAVFKDWFQSEKGWKGIVGKPPTKEQFAEAITDYDMLIYCGHGTGGRYFHGDDIEKLQGRAAIILMGCSSGKLSVKGQLEPSGMMISYFLAGCPCMIANLWDVTDRDIDKYLQHLLTTWLASENGTSLPKLVQESRQACKMKYLIGCAPVVYGLPVVIRRQ